MRNTTENIMARLRQLYLPVAFLEQYSHAVQTDVFLGSAKLEERSGGLHAVIFPLIMGCEELSNKYTLTVRGFGFADPDPLAASYSGSHPLAPEVLLVQLHAWYKDGNFIREGDSWVDITFPGIERKAVYDQPRLQAQGGKQRVRVATATPLPNVIRQQLDELLRGF